MDELTAARRQFEIDKQMFELYKKETEHELKHQHDLLTQQNEDQQKRIKQQQEDLDKKNALFQDNIKQIVSQYFIQNGLISSDLATLVSLSQEIQPKYDPFGNKGQKNKDSLDNSANTIAKGSVETKDPKDTTPQEVSGQQQPEDDNDNCIIASTESSSQQQQQSPSSYQSTQSHIDLSEAVPLLFQSTIDFMERTKSEIAETAKVIQRNAKKLSLYSKELDKRELLLISHQETFNSFVETTEGELEEYRMQLQGRDGALPQWFHDYCVALYKNVSTQLIENVPSKSSPSSIVSLTTTFTNPSDNVPDTIVLSTIEMMFNRACWNCFLVSKQNLHFQLPHQSEEARSKFLQATILCKIPFELVDTSNSLEGITVWTLQLSHKGFVSPRPFITTTREVFKYDPLKTKVYFSAPLICGGEWIQFDGVFETTTFGKQPTQEAFCPVFGSPDQLSHELTNWGALPPYVEVNTHLSHNNSIKIRWETVKDQLIQGAFETNATTFPSYSFLDFSKKTTSANVTTTNTANTNNSLNLFAFGPPTTTNTTNTNPSNPFGPANTTNTNPALSPSFSNTNMIATPSVSIWGTNNTKSTNNAKNNNPFGSPASTAQTSFPTIPMVQPNLQVPPSAFTQSTTTIAPTPNTSAFAVTQSNPSPPLPHQLSHVNLDDESDSAK